MKFLNDTVIDSNAVTLLEGEEGNKKMYIQGIFMQGNIQNKNKRMYPTKTLVKECERYNKEVVEQNQALGELNHPERISVDPEKASHRIVKMWVEGNNVMGKALVLDTPSGKIVKALLDGGTRIGVSSRAVGTTKQMESYNEVQDDFRLSCVDIVMNPSAPDAMVNHIMESKNFALFEGTIVEVNEATEAAILAKHGCGCPLPLKEEAPEPVKVAQGMSEEAMLKVLEAFAAGVAPTLVREASGYKGESGQARLVRNQVAHHSEIVRLAGQLATQNPHASRKDQEHHHEIYKELQDHLDLAKHLHDKYHAIPEAIVESSLAYHRQGAKEDQATIERHIQAIKNNKLGFAVAKSHADQISFHAKSLAYHNNQLAQGDVKESMDEALDKSGTVYSGPKRDTMETSGMEYVGKHPDGGHILKDKDSGKKELWMHNKGHASYGITHGKLDLEFAHSLKD